MLEGKTNLVKLMGELGGQVYNVYVCMWCVCVFFFKLETNR